jgi:hypothetical protein
MSHGTFVLEYILWKELGKARPGRDADYSPPSTAEVKNE